MDETEKKAFLKKMGFGGSALAAFTKDEDKKKKEKTANRVDRDDLLAVARIFNMHPNGNKAKIPTLEEHLETSKETDGE
jgi:hypothetical protein